MLCILCIKTGKCILTSKTTVYTDSVDAVVEEPKIHSLRMGYVQGEVVHLIEH